MCSEYGNKKSATKIQSNMNWIMNEYKYLRWFFLPSKAKDQESDDYIKKFD
jgi:hypothetical protein